MRIGQLARSTGVSTDTIRYYERIGLLPRAARTDSGYRDYPAGAANRIRVIRNAVQLGFPLKAIARVMRVRDAGGAPCRQVRDYAEELVREIDARITQLNTKRRSMLAMIRQWDGKLAQAQGARAYLLEELTVSDRPSCARRSGSAGSRESRGASQDRRFQSRPLRPRRAPHSDT